MERVTLTPEVGLSRIVYGMWRLADAPDHSPGHVAAKIDACLNQGITSFDQADIYGDYGGESILGACLAANPGLRQQMELITKCGIVAPVGPYADTRLKHYDTSRQHITQAVERSLKALSTDHVDLLLIHRPDPFMNAEETGAVLDALVSAGKVRAVGVSNFKSHDHALLQAAMKSPLATNQIEISVLESSPFHNGEIVWMQTAGIPPMAWSPLGGGRLFCSHKIDPYEGQALVIRVHRALSRLAEEHGVKVADVAIAWLLAHPARIMPVLGTNNLDRIKCLENATKMVLDRQSWFEIYTASRGQEVP